MKAHLALASVVIGCAGAERAPAQSTFIMHFDSVQLGYPGTAYCIVEVPLGYMITGLQASPDTLNQARVFFRTIDQQGVVTGERQVWNGIDNGFNLLNVVPVNPGDTTFVGSLVRFDPDDYFVDRTLQFAAFTAEGDTVFTRTISAPSTMDSITFNMNETTALSDGGYAMAGWTQHTLGADVQAQGWLLRLDENGDTLWTKQIGPAEQYVEAYSLREFLNGGLSVTGIRSDGTPQDNSFLQRYDSLGSLLWTRYYGAQGGGSPPTVRVTQDSCLLTWSSFRISNWNPPQYKVLNLRKWDANGNLLWSQLTEARGQEMSPQDMEVLPDGNIICGAGYFGSTGLWKFNSEGDSLWLRRYNVFQGLGGGFTTPHDVLPTSDGGFAICGDSQQGQGDPHPGRYTWFVIKTDSLGCVVPGCQYVGLAENVIGLENTLKVYPNPSDGLFTLELALPETLTLSGDLTVQVFDAQGRLVERRNLGKQFQQRVSLDLTAQPAGLYSAHLSDGKRILTGARLVIE